MEGIKMFAQYFYDYRGNRVKKIENGVETKYVYSGLNIVKETTNNVDTFYIYGPNIDEPFYSITNGTRSYYYPDGLGSIKKLKNSELTNSYIYDVWGQVVKADGTINNPYGYTGREFTNTDLYYYRARYYQPGVGRFLSQDPVWGSETEIHRYVYVKNNAINNVDPMGLFSVLVHGNYCGWGNKNPRGTPPGAQVKPVDRVDAACQAHDNCYERHGISVWNPMKWFNRMAPVCDRELCQDAWSGDPPWCNIGMKLSLSVFCIQFLLP